MSNSKRRRGNSKRSKNRLLHRMLFLVAAIVIGCILVYVISSSFRNRNLVDDFDPQASTWTADSDDELFEQFLENGNVNQFAAELQNLSDDSTLELPVRLNRIDKRVAVADRIIDLATGDDSKLTAFKAKLESLMARVAVSLDNEIETGQRTAELAFFYESLIDQSDDELTRQIEVAKTLNATSRFLDGHSRETGAFLRSVAIENFTKTASANSDNHYVAEQLFSFLPFVSKRIGVEAQQEFLEVLDQAYSQSTNEDIVSLLDEKRVAIESGENQFVDVIDVTKLERLDAIPTLVEQIDAALGSNDLSGSTMRQIFHRMQDLLRVGKVKQVKSIRDKIVELPSGVVTESLQKQFGNVNKKIMLFDQPLDISAFVDVNGKPVKFGNELATYKLLFVLSVNKYSQSVLQFRKLAKSLNSQLRDSKVEIAIVYLQHEEPNEATDDVRILAQNSKRWQVWFLPLGSESAISFLQQLMPIPEFPYIMILGGDDDKVKYLGASLAIIEEEVVFPE